MNYNLRLNYSINKLNIIFNYHLLGLIIEKDEISSVPRFADETYCALFEVGPKCINAIEKHSRCTFFWRRLALADKLKK
jgi:hypothetical protein